MFITYLIIALFVGIIFAIYCREDLQTSDKMCDRILYFVISAGFGAIISFVLWLFTHLFSCYLPIPVAEYDLETSTPIYAIEDNHYLLRTGKSTYDEVLYLVEEELGLQTKKLKEYSNNVYYKTVGTGESPCLETHIAKFEKGFWDLFINADTIDRKKYVFKVPENSIKQDYNIDLQ